MITNEPIEITKGNDNLFEDLGFDYEEATNLKIRTDLMLDLRKYIQEKDWSQAKAADFFQETQPTINNLMNGEISSFSIDQLINMLAKTGMKIKVKVEF
jgi:predicted XRE-type DNA-binding protein